MLVLASVMLLLGSLASVAVPKLAGQLIDDCINLNKFASAAAAKHKVDGAHCYCQADSLHLPRWRHACTSPCLCTMRLSGRAHAASRGFGRTNAQLSMAEGKHACCAEVLYEILIILAVGGVCSGLRAWLFNGAAERVMARLRSRMFSHLMGQGAQIVIPVGPCCC